jgi:hypothetical protein
MMSQLWIAGDFEMQHAECVMCTTSYVDEHIYRTGQMKINLSAINDDDDDDDDVRD